MLEPTDCPKTGLFLSGDRGRVVVRNDGHWPGFPAGNAPRQRLPARNLAGSPP